VPERARPPKGSGQRGLRICSHPLGDPTGYQRLTVVASAVVAECTGRRSTMNSLPACHRCSAAAAPATRVVTPGSLRTVSVGGARFAAEMIGSAESVWDHADPHGQGEVTWGIRRGAMSKTADHLAAAMHRLSRCYA